MDPIAIVFIIIVVALSIIVHEVAHGFAADMLGDPTARLQGRLTLNPISHIDLFGSIILPGFLLLTQPGFVFGWAKPVPYNPYNLRNQKWGEAIVAGAGPLINISIALIFGLLLRFDVIEAFAPNAELFVGYIVYFNILLALFNLIPIPPLDGSKILKALLPYKMAYSYARFEETLLQYGFITLIAFLIIFALFFAPILHQIITYIFWVITGSYANF